jgi:hypothetical protein
MIALSLERLTYGKRFQCHTANFSTFFPSGRTVLVAQPDESFDIVDSLLVTDLEFKAAAAANGKGRRKPGRG